MVSVLPLALSEKKDEVDEDKRILQIADVPQPREDDGLGWWMFLSSPLRIITKQGEDGVHYCEPSPTSGKRLLSYHNPRMAPNLATHSNRRRYFSSRCNVVACPFSVMYAFTRSPLTTLSIFVLVST